MVEYTLAVSEAEVARYRLMAHRALAVEARQLALAGVVPGAAVADVGCGPAAMSVELARMVGPTGSVQAVERDDSAIAAARQVIGESGLTNVELRQGSAAATGVEPGSVDVAMMRHVLAHNGGDEQEIVDHLATLVRPGGAVYLVDVDLTGVRTLDGDPGLEGLTARYAQFHASRGNDPMVGLRLGKLLGQAGLEVEDFTGSYNIIEMPVGVRPPSWAARDAMLASGSASEAEIGRWGEAFDRLDAAPVRPTLFAPLFVGIGRKP
ncbi:MAG: methyltransferase domain-containing protein [Marmoricola sp.]